MRKRAEDLQVGDYIVWAPSLTGEAIVSEVIASTEQIKTQIRYNGTSEDLTWNPDTIVWTSEYR